MKIFLNNPKFKLLVTILVIFAFMNMSVPFASAYDITAYAAENHKVNNHDQNIFQKFISQIESIYNGFVDSFKGLFKTNSGTVKNELNTQTNNQTVSQTANTSENIVQRTEYSKTVKIDDNKFKTEIYKNPINYKNYNGEYKEINNLLKTSNTQSFDFENTANSFKTYFAKNSSKKHLAQVNNNGYSVSWSLVGSNNVKAVTDKNVVRYDEILKYVSLRYAVDSNKLKEDLLLKFKDAPDTFKFQLFMNNLSYTQDKDGSITFYKKDSEEKVFVIQKPFMIDANGNESKKVNLSIYEQNGNTYLEVKADQEWLQSKDRMYPVTIDPTFFTQPGLDGYDTYIDSRYPDYPDGNNWDTPYLYVAQNDSKYWTAMSLIKFDAANYIPVGAKVTNATVNVYQYGAVGYNGYVNLHQIWSDWQSRWVVWNTRPSINPTPESSAYSNMGDGWLGFNVTSMVQRWVNRSNGNYGVALSFSGTGRRTIYTTFTNPDWSELNPKLTVDYTTDVTPPNGSITINNGNQYTSDRNVQLSLSANDDSNPILMHFKDDYSDWSGWEYYNPYKNWTLTPGDGTRNIYVQYADAYWNISTYSDSIQLDTTPPTAGNLTSPNNDLSSRSVTFKWTGANDATTGIDHYQVVASKVNDNFATTGNYVVNNNINATTLQYTVTLPGDYNALYWTIFAYDKVGNRSQFATFQFAVDTTPPSIPTITNMQSYTKTLQNTVTWTPSTDSGLGGITYEIQKSTDSNFATNVDKVTGLTATSYTFTNLQENTPYYYRVRAIDKLNNTSNWSGSTSSIQDYTVPVITDFNLSNDIFSPGLNTTSVSASLTEVNLSKWDIAVSKDGITVRTANGTTNTVNWTWDGKNNSGSYVGEGTYNIKLTATDKAGYTATITKTVIVDTTLPTINLSLPTEGAITNQRVYQVQGTYSDNNLPLDSIKVNGTPATLGANNTFTSDVFLTEGWNLVTVQATDRAGNITVVNRNVLMDETPAVITGLTPSDGNTIGTTKPTISANYMDNISGLNLSTARIYVDGAEVTDKSSITSLGISYFPDTDLAKGMHNVKVEIEDIAGNKQSTSWQFTVDVDTFVSILQPIDNSRLNKTLADILGMTEKGNNLELYINDTATASVNNADENYNFSGINLVEGTNFIIVLARDIFNHSKEASVQVYVDTTAPAASIEANPKYISPNGDGQQDTTALQLSADGTGTQLKDWAVTISNSTGLVMRTFSDLGAPPTTITWDGKDQAGNIVNDGIYTYRLTVHDFGGKETVTATKEIAVDTVAPSNPIIEKPPADLYGNQATVQLQGTAEANAFITLINNGVVVNAVQAGADGKWNYQMPLNGGVNVLTAKATDAAGNTSSESNSVQVTVTTVPPIEKVEASPLLGSNGNMITLKATTTDIARNVQALTPDGKVINLVPLNLTTWVGYWQIDPSVADGIAVVNFTANDLAGNKGFGTLGVVVDNTAPQVPLIKAPIGNIDSNLDVFTFNGEAEPYAQVLLYSRMNGQTTLSGEVTTDANGQWNLTGINLPEGELEIWANSVDAAGNNSADSAKVIIRVDKTAPDVTGQVAPLYIPVGHSLHLTAQTSLDATQVLTIMPDGAVGYLDHDVLAGTWTGDITVGTSIADGTYDVYFRAFDAAGNENVIAAKLVVDSTPPDKPVITKPVTDEFTNIVNYQVEGTAEKDSTVTLYYWDKEGLQYKTVVAADGTWKTVVPLLEGQNTLYATATDWAGNVSARSEQITFTLDTIPPPAPYINIPANNSFTNKPQQAVTGTGDPFATITLYYNGQVVDYPIVGANGEWTSKTLTFKEGINTLQAKATDRAKNTGELSTLTSFTLDTVPPNPPTQYLKTDRTNRYATTVYGSAEANAMVTVYMDDSKIGNTWANAQGSWQFGPFAIDEDKIHSFTSTATDAATNVSGKSNPSKVLRYVVVSGDDLAGIANFYYGNTSKANDIKQYNDLTSDRLYHEWNLLLPEPAKDGRYSYYRYELEKTIAELENRLRYLSTRTSCGQAGEPVNTSLGNFNYSDTDIKLAAGWGIPLEINRGYNSMDYYHGPLGYGWNFNYNIKLNFYEYQGVNYVEVMNYDGRRDLYIKKADGTYQGPQGIFDTLQETKEGNFVWETKDKVKYYFNDYGRLIYFADSNGNKTTLNYNEQSLLTDVTDAEGRKLTFDYDQERRITLITDPAGREFKYGYDEAGNLTAVTYPDGSQVKYAYDELHQMTSFMDPNGNYVVRSTYDAEGRVIKQLDAKGNLSTFSYDAVNRKTIFTDARGNSITDEFDEQKRLVARTDQLGNKEVYTYDENGNRNSVTDKNGKTTLMSYDGRGNLITVIDPLGQETKFNYDAKDNLLSITNPLGHKVTLTYNDFNEPLTITDARGNTTGVEYNDKGHITAITDAKNNKTTFTYDEFGNVNKITDANGNETKISYNSLGWRTTLTTPKGESTIFEYDAKGNNTGVIDPLGQKTEYTYDQNGNVISTKDARGNITNFHFDANGNMDKVTDANGVETWLSHDANGNRTSIANALGNKTSYQYDALNRVQKVIDALGNETSVSYDANGNAVMTKDANGNVTKFAYDALNRLVETTDALNQSIKAAYDAAGNLTTYTDQTGNTTSYSYNPNKQLEKITDAQNNITQITYDALGNREKVTDARGNSYSYSYDATGKIVKITDPTGHYTVIDYDANGNQTGLTDANGNTTKLGYDALNRLVSITDALNDVTNIGYDANGNRTALTDANDNKTQYVYDAMNRLTKVVDALGVATEYGYNPLGSLVQVKDGNGNITKYEYDADNRVTAAIDPLGNTTRVSYDPAGNIAKRTDAKGADTVYNYNPLNLLTQVLYPDNTSVNYAFDATGRRTQMTDKSGTTNYKYDVLGRILEVTGADGKKVSYGYDAVGNRTSLQYPDGKVVQYIYDEMNRMKNVTEWDGKTTTYQYDAAGRRTKTLLPNGNAEVYGYDAANRLLSLVNQNTAGIVLSSFNYTYDKVGNRTSMTTADGTNTQYQYDPLYQLKKVLPSVGKSTDYTYDKAGNRLTMAEIEGNSISTTNYEYNGANELLKKIDPNGQVTQYNYDANGNRTAKIGNNYTTSFSYDFENRLTGIDEHNGKTITYDYNGDGVRLAKTVNNPNNTKEVTKYVNDVANPLEQVLAIYDENDKQEATYTYGLERISVHDTDTATGAQKDPLYYLYDGLGSVAQLTDTTGKVVDKYSFDAFGNDQPSGTQTANASHVLNNLFGYTGEQWDVESGMLYLRARYYDPEIGRFINKDTELGTMMNPLSQNRYSYVQNNPVNLTDPSGHRPVGMSLEDYVASLKQQVAVAESYSPSVVNCHARSNSGDSGQGSYDDRTSNYYSGLNHFPKQLGTLSCHTPIGLWVSRTFYKPLISFNGDTAPSGAINQVGVLLPFLSSYQGNLIVDIRTGDNGYDVKVSDYYNTKGFYTKTDMLYRRVMVYTKNGLYADAELKTIQGQKSNELDLEPPIHFNIPYNQTITKIEIVTLPLIDDYGQLPYSIRWYPNGRFVGGWY